MTSVLTGGSIFARDLGLMLFSMTPMMENKATILLAATLNVKWYVAYICTSIGCFLPTPFLLERGTRTLERLRKYRPIDTCMAKVDDFVEGHPKFFKKNAYLSLLLIISIPFTGIGIWAGCVISNVLGLEKKRSLYAITAAIAISGLVTTLTTYGIVVGLRSVAGLL